MNGYKQSEYFSSYGAWLYPDGDLISVPSMEQHETIAEKIAKDKGFKFNFNKNYAGSVLRKHGYITLTFMGGMLIWYEVPPTDTQIKKLISLFNSRIGGSEYVRIAGPNGNDFAKTTEELSEKLL